jgi:acetyl-CoA carboxylase biotin carboxyl carrier protein
MPKTKVANKKTVEKQPPLDQVVKIIELMGNNRLSEIDLETKNLKLSLRKYSASQQQTIAAPPAVEPVFAPQNTANNVEIPVVKEVVPDQEKEAEKYHKIVSPMAGTFYRAPSPTSPPFVKEGDEILPGQTVCIVEAMKMMNEIKADKVGKIVKILFENGVPVDKGENLFYIGD